MISTTHQTATHYPTRLGLLNRRKRADFTKYDYIELRDAILGEGPGSFSVVYPVGDEEQRQIRLTGYVDLKYYEDGDDYTTPRDKWYEAKIVLKTYECRTFVLKTPDNPRPRFEDGDPATCNFSPQMIDGYTEEVDW